MYYLSFKYRTFMFLRKTGHQENTSGKIWSYEHFAQNKKLAFFDLVLSG